MATLETLDILFKSSGKGEILKEIEEIEKSWTKISSAIKENIELLKAARTERAEMAKFSKEAATSAKMEAAYLDRSAKNWNKILDKRFKVEKAKERTEKARERAAREERKGRQTTPAVSTTTTAAPEKRRMDWGQWGGLASVLSLMGSVAGVVGSGIQKIVGAVLSAGQEGVLVQRILEDERNKEGLKKLLSDIAVSGMGRGLQSGQMISAIAQLRQQWDEAFRLNKQQDFFDRFGLVAKNFKRGDFTGFLQQLVSPNKTAQQKTALRAAFGTQESEALLNFSTHAQNIYQNIESSVEAMGKLNTALQGLQRDIANTFAPSLAEFAKEIQAASKRYSEWLNTPSGQQFIDNIRTIAREMAEFVPIIVNFLSGLFSNKTREIKEAQNQEIEDIAKKLEKAYGKKSVSYIWQAKFKALMDAGISGVFSDPLGINLNKAALENLRERENKILQPSYRKFIDYISPTGGLWKGEPTPKMELDVRFQPIPGYQIYVNGEHTIDGIYRPNIERLLNNSR